MPTLDGGQDPLTPYGMQNFSDPLICDGEQHDSLTDDGGPRIAGVDWDKPKSCMVSIAGKPIFGLSPSAFIDWYNAGADGVDAVCFERPHLRARGDFSRAQIWTADDLERLTDGPPIFMPNGKKLHKMAAYAGNLVEHKIAGKIEMKPDKAKDSESIRRYAEDHRDIMHGWKRFVPPSQDTTSATHEHRDALRYEISRTINEWRELWQDVKGKDATRALPFVVPAAAILDAAFDDISKETKAIFKLTRSKGTVNLAQGRTRVMTVYAMAYDRDDVLRTHNGRPLGRSYLIKDVIGLCDSYMPNMARANLTGYGKTGLAGVGSRTDLNRAVKELLRVFQEADALILHGKHDDSLMVYGAQPGQDSLTVDGGHDPLTAHGEPGHIFEGQEV